MLLSAHLFNDEVQAWEYADPKDEDEFIELMTFEKKKQIATSYGIRLLLKENRRKKTVKTRHGKEFRKQTDPDMLIDMGVRDGLLVSEYRMGKDSIKKLYGMLKDKLEPKETARGDAILGKTKLLVTLRFLAGSRWVDCCRIHGISKSSVTTSVKQVCRAIADHPTLGKVTLPQTEKECQAVAAEWSKKSGSTK